MTLTETLSTRLSLFLFFSKLSSIRKENALFLCAQKMCLFVLFQGQMQSNSDTFLREEKPSRILGPHGREEPKQWFHFGFTFFFLFDVVKRVERDENYSKSLFNLSSLILLLPFFSFSLFTFFSSALLATTFEGRV